MATAMPVISPLVTAGATLYGANTAGQSAENIANKNAELNKATSAEQIAEMKRQFNITGELGQADKQLEAEQLARSQNINLGSQDIQKQAYQQAIKDIAAKTGKTEEQFFAEAGKAAPEIEQLKKDIESGNTKSMGALSSQIGASLAQQGVRGGQAGNILKRALGDQAESSQRDINQLLASDAQSRQAARLGYEASKAGLGNEFATSATTAGMYDSGAPTYSSLNESPLRAGLPKLQNGQIIKTPQELAEIAKSKEASDNEMILELRKRLGGGNAGFADISSLSGAS